MFTEMNSDTGHCFNPQLARGRVHAVFRYIYMVVCTTSINTGL